MANACRQENSIWLPGFRKPSTPPLRETELKIRVQKYVLIFIKRTYKNRGCHYILVQNTTIGNETGFGRCADKTNAKHTEAQTNAKRPELEKMTETTWTPEKPEFNHIKKKLLEYYITMNYASSQLSINAFERVARSVFVPEGQRAHAYNDSPLPIGHGQTISAPHMAFMECDALDILPGDKVLEIGSGSGYHACIAAEMCAPSDITPENWEPLTRYYNDDVYEDYARKKGKVYTVERLEALVTFARKNIQKAGYEHRVTVVHGDGTMGLEEYAPYDKVLVTAAGPTIPDSLKRQLKIDGRLIIPVGSKNFYQELLLVTRVSENKWTQHNVGGVVFVPLIGKYGFEN